MSLVHAILGLLDIQPMTGYDLKNQAFDSTVAHFWQADQAQIYRTLSAMAEDGWLRCEVQVQEDRPNRKVYHLTEAGRAELLRWLRQPQGLMAERDGFLVQMFFGNHLSDAELLAQIEAQLALHEARLAAFRAVPMPPLDELSGERMRSLWRLTLDYGIQHEEGAIAWLKRCREWIVEG